MTERVDPAGERTPHGDAALARRAASGDVDAFEELVRTHTNGIWRVTYALLHDEGAAEEATQDTFVRAHRSLDQFRADSSLKTWLTVIARRVCIDRLRKAKLDTVALTDAAAADSAERFRGATSAGGNDGDASVSAITLGTHLDRLLPEHREAFLLVDALGYTAADAAEVIDVPASTLRSRVSTARRQLAASLTAEDPAWATRTPVAVENPPDSSGRRAPFGAEQTGVGR